jgi:hypothetical protein
MPNDLAYGINSKPFGGAGHIILKGMAGEGLRIIIAFNYLQIGVKAITHRPGGVGVTEEEEQDDSNPHLVEVTISYRWPFMAKPQTNKFIIEKKWANVVVNRIKKINTFNDKFTTTFGAFKEKIETQYSNIRDRFGVKWKK